MLDKKVLEKDILKELEFVTMDFYIQTGQIQIHPFAPDLMTKELNNDINSIRSMTYIDPDTKYSEKVTGLEAIVKSFSKKIIYHLENNFSLNDLSDVTISEPQTGDIISYVNGEWKNIRNTTTTTIINPDSGEEEEEVVPTIPVHNHGVGLINRLAKFRDSVTGNITYSTITENTQNVSTSLNLILGGYLEIGNVPHLDSVSDRVLVHSDNRVYYRSVAEIVEDIVVGSHNHNDLYYLKTELQTAGQSQVHYNNLTNVPLTFAPSNHASNHLYGASDTIFPLFATGETNGFLYNNAGTLSWTSIDIESLGLDLIFAAKVHYHSASDITSGILGVTRGGTGINNFTSGYLKANGTNAFTTASNIPWLDLSGVPSTFTPSSHTLISSHTVSGLTTGHFLKATSATTFGFVAHGLTYSDVGAQQTDATLTALAALNSTVGFIYQTGADAFTKYGFGGSGSATTVSRSDHTHSGYEPVISSGLSTQYWRGDKSWQVLNTSVVPEVTNLYYTDNRVQTFSDTRYQLKDADLTSIAGLTGTSGLLRKTAANTWSLDTNVYLTEIADGSLSIAKTYGLQTALNSKWSSSNDGSGSGLDADLLDGLHKEDFLRADANNSYPSHLLFSFDNTPGRVLTGVGEQTPLRILQPTAGADAGMTFHIANNCAVYFGLDGTTNDLFVGGWSMGALKNKIWHSGNDGSGSGLDADLLDGYHANNFVGKNGNPYYQADGWIQFSGSVGLYFPNSGAGTHFHPNNSSYNYASFIIQGSRGGYQGFYFRDCVNGLTLMHRTSDGLGGMYYQATATWQWYYDPAIENIRIMGNYPVWHSGNLIGDQTGHYHTSVYNSLTQNYLPKYNGSSAFANSSIYDNGTNVGIGTNNPLHKLSINGDVYATGSIFSDYGCYAFNDAANGTYIGVFKYKGALPGYPTSYYPVLKTDTDYIHFSCNGRYTGYLGNDEFGLYNSSQASRVRLTTNNNSYIDVPGYNFGIGTNNPTNKLQVAGRIWADDHIISGTACCASHYESTKAAQGSYIGVFKNAGSLPGYDNDYYPTLKTDCNYIHFSCNGRYTGYLGNDEFGLFDSNMVRRIIFTTNGDSYFNGGNVGIGTTDPGSYKLYVNGSFYATTMSRSGYTVWDSGNLIGVRDEHKHVKLWCADDQGYYIDARNTGNYFLLYGYTSAGAGFRGVQVAYASNAYTVNGVGVSGLSTNYLVKYNGTNFTASTIFDNGATVGYTASSYAYMSAGANIGIYADAATGIGIIGNIVENLTMAGGTSCILRSAAIDLGTQNQISGNICSLTPKVVNVDAYTGRYFRIVYGYLGYYQFTTSRVGSIVHIKNSTTDTIFLCAVSNRTDQYVSLIGPNRSVIAICTQTDATATIWDFFVSMDTGV